MLTLDKLSQGREAYYLATVATGRDHERLLVEPEGYWLGQGSAALELEGPVVARAVRAVMRARHPATGEGLVPRKLKVAGFDLTFSPPKSVSIVHALAGQEVTVTVRAAHDSAVAAALGYLEAVACSLRGRSGAGFVACGWPHRASRAPDPHLHTHVLIANLVPGETGVFGALDARDLYAEIRTAGALYETHLRYRLTLDLGVRWQPLPAGITWSDIEGIDRAAVIAFSRRGAEIEGIRLEEGLSPGAGRIIGANTRPPKRLDTPYEVTQQEWVVKSWELGLSKSKLAGLTPGALTDVERSLAAARQEGWEDVTLAIAGVRAVEGCFTRRQLIQARCAAAPTGLPVAEVQRDVDVLLSSEAVVPLGARQRRESRGAGPSRAEPSFTTAAIVAQHDRLAGRVRDRSELVTVVAYEPGRRLETLDALCGAAEVWSVADGGPVIATAPGRRAAAAFEAATGIEAVPTRLDPGGVVRSGSWAGGGEPAMLVVADAHRLESAEIERLVAETSERSVPLTLVAPSAAVERHPGLSRVAAEATGRLPVPAREQVIERPAVAPPVEHHLSFAGGDVTLVASAREARQAAVAGACTLAASGSLRPVAIVAGEMSVVEGLQEMLRAEPAAGRAGVVAVHARDLDRVLAGSGRGRTATMSLPAAGSGLGAEHLTAPRPAVVCLGGAGVLQRGSGRLAELDRQHVVVVPALTLVPAGSARALGLAAEAVAPRYLTGELGALRDEPSSRAAWRQAAVEIEEHRRHHGVEDPRLAYGRRHPREPSGVSLERAKVRARVAELVPARRGPARGLDHGPDAELGRDADRGRDLGLGFG